MKTYNCQKSRVPPCSRLPLCQGLTGAGNLTPTAIAVNEASYGQRVTLYCDSLCEITHINLFDQNGYIRTVPQYRA